MRLVYPAAVVLLDHTWAALALAISTFSIFLSLIRGWTADQLTRRVRAELFDSLSWAIENYPALPPPGSPPIEQLESEIARGVPWVEALIGSTLPSVIGNAVVLPIIAWLSWVQIGTRATLVASVALLVGIVVAAVVAREVGAIGEAAWARYQPVARLIESGFRGRVELGVHLRASAHRARLMTAVMNWSTAERKSFVWGGLAAWTAPVATALAAVALVGLTGAHPLRLIQQVVSHPTRSVLIASLLALTALPVLASLTRGLAEWSKERPHLDALQRFVASASPSTQIVNGSAPPGALPLGLIRADRVRFAYPCRYPDEAASVIEGDLVWRTHETLAISGPNGCGKTTLTWLLMGVIVPQSGRIEIGGANQQATLTGRVAYLPQQPYFDDTETVYEAIRFVAPAATENEIELLISSLFGENVAGNVEAFLQRRVMSLSMGERRAVAVARVLLRKSEIAILDEPEANLGGDLRRQVMSILSSAKARCRMLIVTHDEAFASLADRVYRMPSRTTQSEMKSASAAE